MKNWNNNKIDCDITKFNCADLAFGKIITKAFPIQCRPINFIKFIVSARPAHESHSHTYKGQELIDYSANFNLIQHNYYRAPLRISQCSSLKLLALIHVSLYSACSLCTWLSQFREIDVVKFYFIIFASSDGWWSFSVSTLFLFFCCCCSSSASRYCCCCCFTRGTFHALWCHFWPAGCCEKGITSRQTFKNDERTRWLFVCVLLMDTIRFKLLVYVGLILFCMHLYKLHTARQASSSKNYKWNRWKIAFFNFKRSIWERTPTLIGCMYFYEDLACFSYKLNTNPWPT